MLPPLRPPPNVDEGVQRKRANERARALLKGRFRDFQAQNLGGLGSDATKSTDAFFRQREESRANKPPPRDPLPTFDLVTITRRKRVERGEGLGKMFGR